MQLLTSGHSHSNTGIWTQVFCGGVHHFSPQYKEREGLLAIERNKIVEQKFVYMHIYKEAFS